MRGIQLALALRQLSAAQSEIRKLQRIDTLTGLYRREHVAKQLQEMLDRSKARRQSLGLIAVEVDSFEEFIERYGTLEGDILLRSIAELLTTELTDHDALCGRYNESTYVVVLPNTSRRTLTATAEHLRRSVYELGIKHEKSSVAPFVTVTNGCALYAAGEEMDADLLLQRARAAVRQGQGNGHNCVQV